jgi:HAD superfamily hydrolase (TIGR01509 family)
VIRALLFDFDGLILDTEGPIYQSWVELFERYQANLPLSLWVTIIGTSEQLFDPWQILEQQAQRPIDREAESIRRRQRQLALVELQPVLPGVTGILEQARQMELITAVVTSSSRSWVEGHLDRLGLLQYFDRLITRDDVSRTKPDPELYLKALQAFELEPAEALVFEDSPNGIRAAHAAGICAVAVPNDLTRSLPVGEADLVVASLDELPLADILLKICGKHCGGAAENHPRK